MEKKQNERKIRYGKTLGEKIKPELKIQCRTEKGTDLQSLWLLLDSVFW